MTLWKNALRKFLEISDIFETITEILEGVFETISKLFSGEIPSEITEGFS